MEIPVHQWRTCFRKNDAEKPVIRLRAGQGLFRTMPSAQAVAIEPDLGPKKKTELWRALFYPNPDPEGRARWQYPPFRRPKKGTEIAPRKLQGKRSRTRIKGVTNET